MVLVALVATTGCREKEEPKVPAAPAPAPQQQRLAADGFRPDLIAIDRYVFAEGPMDAERRAMLSGMLDGLATRLAVPNAPPFVTAGVKDLGDLAMRVRSIPEGPVPPEVAQEWVRVRGALFTAREWFATSAEHVAPLAAGEAVADPFEGEASPAAGRFELTGRWRVARVTVGGQPATDADFLGAIWRFEQDRLSINQGELGGEFTFIDYIDSKGKALRFEAEEPRAMHPNGWMKYAFTEDGRLRIAFFEGFDQRPDTFAPDAEAVTDPPVTTATSSPAPQTEPVPRPPTARAPRAYVEMILDPIQ